MRNLFLFIFIVLHMYCHAQKSGYIQVLGVAQDGGYPHIGCSKQCCKMAWENPEMKRYVVALAIVDSANNKWWLMEATPDIREQLQYFRQLTNGRYRYRPDGIIITHAHIGHYTGLMQLGREAMGAKNMPVYVLPKMKQYLEDNGPWSQLVRLNNITINALHTGVDIALSNNISLQAIVVPHRDEYSETAGYKITAGKKYLFIPDIDKWSKWRNNITDEVRQTDIALLDATFYDNTELPGRSIEEIPHPLVTETIQLFDTVHDTVKHHLHFIHINHTNPLLWDKQKQQYLERKGFRIAQQGQSL